MKKQTNQANHRGHISKKSDAFSERASGWSFRRVPEGTAVRGDGGSMRVTAPDAFLWDRCGPGDSDAGDPANVCVCTLVFNRKEFKR